MLFFGYKLSSSIHIGSHPYTGFVAQLMGLFQHGRVCVCRRFIMLFSTSSWFLKLLRLRLPLPGNFQLPPGHSFHGVLPVQLNTCKFLRRAPLEVVPYTPIFDRPNILHIQDFISFSHRTSGVVIFAFVCVCENNRG